MEMEQMTDVNDISVTVNLFSLLENFSRDSVRCSYGL